MAKDEELNQEDIELAKEALEQTDEKPEVEQPAEKPDPKDAVIGEFRRDLRAANQQIAELQARLNTQATAHIKSPLERAAEEQAFH